MHLQTKYKIKFKKYSLRSAYKAVLKYKTDTWLKLATLCSSFHKSHKQNMNNGHWPQYIELQFMQCESHRVEGHS